MKIINTRLDIGAREPFSLLHISDTHLTRADMRDGERKVALAAERSPHFKEAESVDKQNIFERMKSFFR